MFSYNILVIILQDPIIVIEDIKKALENVIESEDIKYLFNIDTTELLTLYSSDFCSILLAFYPSATIMLNKNFKTCALMIRGKVYNAKGLVERKNYFIADDEEINFIKFSLPKLSDYVFDKLNCYLFDEKEKPVSYNLRKYIH